jgi:hypothetical protein
MKTATYVVALIGAIGTLYYALPGYPHLLPVFGHATAWQPTNSAVCLILFLVCAVIGGSLEQQKSCEHPPEKREP